MPVQLIVNKPEQLRLYLATPQPGIACWAGRVAHFLIKRDQIALCGHGAFYLCRQATLPAKGPAGYHHSIMDYQRPLRLSPLAAKARSNAEATHQKWIVDFERCLVVETG
jgi:hypothetical protein